MLRFLRRTNEISVKVSEICVAHSSGEVDLSKKTVGEGRCGTRDPRGFTDAMGGGGVVSLFQELTAAKPQPDLILGPGTMSLFTLLHVDRKKNAANSKNCRISTHVHYLKGNRSSTGITVKFLCRWGWDRQRANLT